jgi:maleate isomerase
MKGLDYGWRARIGLILPSGNTCMEPEFYWICPEGVTFHSHRVLLSMATAERIEVLAEEVERAAEYLASASVDIIGFGCTAGSFLHGPDRDRALSERVEKRTGIPMVTTSMAVIKAFEELKISKMALATPYIEEINEREKLFFEGLGISVVSIKGMGFLEMKEFIHCPPDTIYRLAHTVNTEEAEGIFISCTGWRAMQVIEILERDLNKPVISSNQATFHALLKRVGIDEKIQGYGKLLRM